MSPDQSAQFSQFIPFIAVMFIFYFLVFKPQSDKQKQHKKMLAELKKNDQIVTISGIHGTIVNIKETTLTLRIDDNVKIEIDKDAVSRLVSKG